MLELLKQKYQTIESLKGKKLAKFIGMVFLVFILIGAIIGYFKPSTLNESENSNLVQPTTVGSYQTYKGIVSYMGEDAYPQDKIQYILTDIEGKDIILLRSNDQKLSIAEGLFVTVSGKLTSTKDKKEQVLQVTEVTLNNEKK